MDKTYGTGSVVAICGENAVGKTTLRCFLRNNVRAVAVATRNPLVWYAEKHGYPTDRRTLQRIWAKLSVRHGDNVIWQRLLAKLRKQDEPVIVIEGLRREVDLTEVHKLAESLDRELLLVYLHAEEGERFRRYNKRQTAEGKDPISEEEWAELEGDETAAQLELVMAAVEEADCGIVIDTTTTTADKIGERVINALPAVITDPT